MLDFITEHARFYNRTEKGGLHNFGSNKDLPKSLLLLSRQHNIDTISLMLLLLWSKQLL